MLAELALFAYRDDYFATESSATFDARGQLLTTSPCRFLFVENTIF